MAIKRSTCRSPLLPQRKDKTPQSIIMSDQMPEAIDQRRRIRERFHDSKARVIKGKPR